MRKLLSAPLSALILVGVVALVYGQSVGFGFVWDDSALVLRDPLIRSWRLIPEGWQQFLFVDARGSTFFRPVQRLTFTADYALFELAPWGYHLTSIALHAAAALALRWLAAGIWARQFGAVGAVIAPFAVALAWAVHPLFTAAVSYVAGRADPLAACFAFCAMRLALDAATSALRPFFLRSVAAALHCFFAACSKEVGLISFLLCTVALFCFRAGARRLLVWGALTAVAVGGYAWLRFSIDPITAPERPPTPFSQRAANVAEAAVEYARLSLLPTDLLMERGMPAAPAVDKAEAAAVKASTSTLAVGGLLILAVGIACFQARGEPALSCAWLAFVVAYLPTSNVFSLNAVVADHWMYQPLAFLLLAAGLTVCKWASSWSPPLRRIALVGFALWVAGLALRTWVRVADWRDQRTFLERTMASGGQTARMWVNLGGLDAKTNPERAEADFERALAISPGEPHAMLGLANLALGSGDHARARDWIARLDGNRVFATARWQTLAVIARREGSGNGLAELARARAIDPADWPLLRLECNYLASEGNRPEALRRLEAFCDRFDFRSEAWLMLARMARESGDNVLAQLAFDRALACDVHLESRLRNAAHALPLVPEEGAAP